MAESTHYTFASGGDFSKYSYEFQTEIGIGEDEIFVCSKCHQAHNKEIIDENNFICAMCTNTECERRIVAESANIFKLGSRFSDAFDLKYQNAEGKFKNMVMGCYGIGISRLMGLIAEKFADEKGLVWPIQVSPFSHVIIVIGPYFKEAKKLAISLELSGSTVLIDDRAI